MHFTYTALDESGAERSGRLEGATPEEVASAIRGRGLFPIEINEVAATRMPPTGRRGFYLPFVRLRDLAFFCRQLGLMLRAGLGLHSSLQLLARGEIHPRLARASERMAATVMRGTSLSEAIAAQGRLFPSMAASLVASAEATGELDGAFASLAAHFDRQAELRAQVMSALLYPLVVLLVSIGVIVFLVVKVLPRFAEFLSSRGAALPAATRFLLELGDFFRSQGVFLLLGAASVAALLWLAWGRPRGRSAIQRVLLSVPVVAGILRTGLLTRTFDCLATLLKSGLPLESSMRAAAMASGNAVFRTELERVAGRVLEGGALAPSLADSRVFPKIAVQVVGVGEETGALDEVMRELARFYDAVLTRRVRVLSTLFEPALLLFVGGIVAYVYYSFFQAVFYLSAYH